MGDVETVRPRLGTLNLPAEELPEVPGTPRQTFVAREDLTTATAAVAGVLSYVGAGAAAMSVVASGGSLALQAAAAAAGTVGASIGAAATRMLGRRRPPARGAVRAASCSGYA